MTVQIERQYLGKWWLPEYPENTIVGNLIIYNNGSYKLESVDFFSHLKASEFRTRSESFKLILGVAINSQTKESKVFHLLHNHLIGTNYSKLNFYRISCSFFLESDSKEQLEHLAFDACYFRPLNLLSFLNESQTELEHIDNENYDIKFTRKKTENLLETEEFSLGIYYGFKMSRPNQSGFAVETIPNLGFKFKNRTNWERMRQLINSLNWFMTLTSFSPSNIEETSFVLNSELEEGTNHNFKFINYDKFVDENYKKLGYYEMLITKNELLEKPHLIKKWLVFHNSNEYFVRNYIANFRNSNQFSDTEFLNITLGIITYSETKFPIKKGNTYKYLKQLVDKYHDCYSSFMIIEDLFLKRVEATRHYYVHESERDTNNIVNDELELFKYIIRLNFLATAIILKEIGFSPNQIDEKLYRKSVGWVAFESKTI